MKKNVLYIDTENGKNQIMERMVQSTLNKTKLEILSGDYDKLEQRHMRKYKRLGVEFIVERVAALVDDTNRIRSIIHTSATLFCLSHCIDAGQHQCCHSDKRMKDTHNFINFKLYFPVLFFYHQVTG